nr:glycosyltransferase 87 family protein [Streptomyces sp. HNM0574]
MLRRPTLLAAACCLLSFAAFWAAQRAAGVSMIDLMVYRAEGEAVRDGEDLYAMRATEASLPTTYPPFAALLFLPLTLIDVPGMRTVATLTNLALLAVLVHLALRLTGRPLRAPRPAVALALAALAVWCEPVWTTLRYGQINLLLAVLVLWDLTRRPGHRWAGAGTGLAAGIKLTPALFAVFLLAYGLARGLLRLRRGGRAADLWNAQVRQAALATGTFLGTALFAAVLLPRDTRTFWTDAVFRSDRVGDAVITDNQSLRGVLARLLHTSDPGLPWLLLALAVAAFGLATAVAAALAGSRRLPYAPAWAALACAVTALLVSPVSWSHHWVWCVPLVVLLGAEALRTRRAGSWLVCGGTALVFCSYALWWVPHDPDAAVPPELGQGAGQMALSAGYPLAALGFLALAALRSARALRRPAPYEPEGAGAVLGGPYAAERATVRPRGRIGRRQAVTKE